ncbi:hypothetical protein AVEN_170272-1 [Araneus ventricosus]|uniref:Uncharacterized protein n=1 Tax=Araneus ventricosus TaxID=182803 RepID=A0A4Y2H8I3_ARAVE|nr:hypothetical protein AVEN_170272-1 [Araneus ventricosus]
MAVALRQSRLHDWREGPRFETRLRDRSAVYMCLVTLNPSRDVKRKIKCNFKLDVTFCHATMSSYDLTALFSRLRLPSCRFSAEGPKTETRFNARVKSVGIRRPPASVGWSSGGLASLPDDKWAP